jgi:hypothetical protein
MRRYSAVVDVKTTTVSGHVILTESGVCMQGHESASAQTVT